MDNEIIFGNKPSRIFWAILLAPLTSVALQFYAGQNLIIGYAFGLGSGIITLAVISTFNRLHETKILGPWLTRHSKVLLLNGWRPRDLASKQELIVFLLFMIGALAVSLVFLVSSNPWTWTFGLGVTVFALWFTMNILFYTISTIKDDIPLAMIIIALLSGLFLLPRDFIEKMDADFHNLFWQIMIISGAMILLGISISIFLAFWKLSHKPKRKEVNGN